MFPPSAATESPPAGPGEASGAAVELHRLVSGFSIEATPKQLEGAGSLAGLLPAGTRVYVPWLPRAAVSDAAGACRKLASRGFEPVPHVAARAIGSRAKLGEHLSRFTDAGVRSLLLIAGDRRRAAGPFAGTLDILDSGLLERRGFRTFGVAGHPQGHPEADETALMRALRAKQDYAKQTDSRLWIVTQFAFTSAPVTAWLERLRAEGIDLPVRIGVPGPAKPQTLLRYALQCGVGSSSRLLAKRPEAIARLLGLWTPDAMLPPLALHAARNPQVAGIHVFPFGGLLQSIDFFTNLSA